MVTAASPLVQPRSTASGSITLDSLAQETCDALEDRFLASQWTEPTLIEGHPRGRVLAVSGWDRGVSARLLAGFARSGLMPWLGKSFATDPAGAGYGINRVRLFGVRFGLFRYRTYLSNSVVDGRPVMAIDYDTPQTPFFARATYDELRPLGGGLYLGRGMARRRRGQPRLLLWFALDTSQPDAPVKL